MSHSKKEKRRAARRASKASKPSFKFKQGKDAMIEKRLEIAKKSKISEEIFEYGGKRI